MDKPVLLFDGECAFCRRCVDRLRGYTQDRVVYTPYQEGFQEYPKIEIQKLQAAVHLILPDGTVFQGARAIFQLFNYSQSRTGKACFFLYRYFPFFGFFSEICYRFVASHRLFFSKFF